MPESFRQSVLAWAWDTESYRTAIHRIVYVLVLTSLNTFAVNPPVLTPVTPQETY